MREKIKVRVEDILEKYNIDRINREQALFTSIFVMQNRIHTAGEKLQKDISMKQWLLLIMVSACPRQNVKKLAVILERKGFIRLLKGKNNSIYIELTNKVKEYSKAIGDKQLNTLNLLFKGFTDEEIKQLFNLCLKLYTGIEFMENYLGGKNDGI